jgi:hypothetical protein
MEMKSRGLKAGPFAELISRSAFITPWTQPLLSCARRDRLEGRTASNRPREGRFRCKLKTCCKCQEKAGIRAGKRAWALISAATDEKPDRNHISAMNVNYEERDLRGFNLRLRNALRRLNVKYTGEYAVSLNGVLHTHFIAVHPDLSREELDQALKEVFPEDRAVVPKELNPEQSIEQAVKNVIQYAGMPPVKKGDRRDHPGLWNPDGLVRYLMLDSQVQGARRLEGGFSLSEKAKAKPILSETNARYRKPKRRMPSIVLEKLKRSAPTPLDSERPLGVPTDLPSLVRKECVEGTEELVGRGVPVGGDAVSPPPDRSVRAEARVGLSLAIEGPVRGLPSLGAAEIASVGQTRPHGGVLVGVEKVDDGLPHAGPVGRGLRSQPLQDIATWSFWTTKGAAEVNLTPGLPAEPAKVTETKG